MTSSRAYSSAIYTIGHSTHPIEHVIDLVIQQGIEAIVDTRSYPSSRYAPQFNRAALRQALAERAIKYAFMGRELGGRPSDTGFYDEEGHVLYNLLADSPLFLDGIARLRKGMNHQRIALLCSEENPEGCHRRLLIGRVLASQGVAVYHIRGDGRLEPESDLAGSERSSVQPALFPTGKPAAWRSIRSVLPRERLATSSSH